MSRPLNPFMPKAAPLPNTGDREPPALGQGSSGGFPELYTPAFPSYRW